MGVLGGEKVVGGFFFEEGFDGKFALFVDFGGEKFEGVVVLLEGVECGEGGGVGLGEGVEFGALAVGKFGVFDVFEEVVFFLGEFLVFGLGDAKGVEDFLELGVYFFVDFEVGVGVVGNFVLFLVLELDF